MTLQIDVDCMDDNGNLVTLDLGDGGHLMGFESFRYIVWGATIMRELGLVLLPSLSKIAMLIVEGDELEILKQEALIIQANLSLIMQHVKPDEQFIMHRTNNVIKAVELAKQCGGQVTIA